MEPISLGLAIASILPLPIELFKQSVQAYKLFIDARESEKAISYFATRLLIEYDRLVQWGKASGLSAASASDPERNHDASSLFRNPDHLALVRRILGHIKDLFDDSVSLAKKYGINIVGNRPTAPAGQRLLGGTESQSSLDKSIGRFTATAKIGFMSLKWAIKDKEGFERLLKDLAQLNDNLYSLHSSDIIRAIIRDTVASVIRQADHGALGNIRRLNGQDFDQTNALVSTVPATDGAVEPFPYESIPTTASAAYMIQQTKMHKYSETNRQVRNLDITSVYDNTPEIEEHPDVRQQASQSEEHKPDLTFSVSYSALDADQDEKSSFTSDRNTSRRYKPWESPLANLKNQSRNVKSASRMRTWNRTTGLEPIRVFLEKKVLLTGSVSRPDLYEDFLVEINSEKRSLEDLVRLLNEASTASAFRSLRCIGMTERHHNRISLIYELPSNIDHFREPMNLATVLESDTQASNIGSPRGGLTVSLPTLTKRFQLAKTLISAMYQLHSASWMHREFSAKNVMFFWSQPPTGTSGSPMPYDLSNPYIDGFKNSRSAVYGLSPFGMGRIRKLPGFLADKVYRHPAYLLHKRNRSRSSPHRSCHRFRHDYYALGLVLLEIGFWSPLSELEVAVLKDSSTPYRNGAFDYALPDEPIGSEDKSSGTVQLSEDWLEETTAAIRNSTYEIREDDTWEKLDAEGWPPGLEEAIIPDLRCAIQDEQIQDVTATPENPRDRQHHLQYLCGDWGDIYPIEMLRQSAIRKAESHLAGCMGDKYQDIVLRCLRSDFGLSGAAPEGEWLHEFNWRVVRSIEQCCV